jgi:ribonuclease R
MELENVECIFSYSGRGFGIAEPVEVNADGAKAEDIFIPPHSTMGAMTGDRVFVTVKQRSGSRSGDVRVEGEVTAIAEPSCCSVVGTLHVKDGHAWVIPDVSRLNVAIYVPMKDCNTLDVGENTKVEVVPDGAPAFNRAMSIHVDRGVDVPFFDTKGRISHVFGDAGTREANYAAILHESGIRTVFSEKVLSEAEASSKEVLTADGRHDLRDRVIFTIDGAGAKDLDDAISIEETANGYILGVHIADVSHYVPYGSAVEKEAAALEKLRRES